mgnify:CR=1 FL=1
MEGITNPPEAVSLQSLMVTVSPATSYVKGSALTSLTPPNSNKTPAEKVEIRWGFNCFLVLTRNYLGAVAVYSTHHFRDDQKLQDCTDPRNPRWF